MKINGREIEPGELQFTQLDDGSARIETSPAPEYILVAQSLWDEAEEWTAPDPLNTEAPERPEHWMWRETLGHMDENVDSAGTLLHLDTVNVSAQYRLVEERPDGTRVLQMASWAER